MKIRIILCLPLLMCSGCETTRIAADGAAGAGGAFIGNKINKDYGAPVGAAIGIGGAEIIQQVSAGRAKAEYARGYDRGKADGVKQLMEGIELNHLPQGGGDGSGMKRASIVLPESRDADGNNLVERKAYVPVN